MVQLKGNLIPASRAHAVSSNVTRVRMCVQGTHTRQKDIRNR